MSEQREALAKKFRKELQNLAEIHAELAVIMEELQRVCREIERVQLLMEVKAEPPPSGDGSRAEAAYHKALAEAAYHKALNESVKRSASMVREEKFGAPVLGLEYHLAQAKKNQAYRQKLEEVEHKGQAFYQVAPLNPELMTNCEPVDKEED